MLPVIVPAYNEEAMVPAAAETIRSILTREDLPHELLSIIFDETEARPKYVISAGCGRKRAA